MKETAPELRKGQLNVGDIAAACTYDAVIATCETDRDRGQQNMESNPGEHEHVTRTRIDGSFATTDFAVVIPKSV
jgi:hypothetical protein